MTHEAPVFNPGGTDLVVGETTVRNCWLLPGDTPAKLRVYTDPFNLSKYADVGYFTTCYGWSNLPKDTLMRFAVSCMYPDGDEKVGEFHARTTGTNAPTPSPLLIQNVGVTVLPYLHGVEVSFDNSEALLHAEVDLQQLPGGTRHLVADLNVSGSGGRTTMTIGPDQLRYATSYKAWLVGRGSSGSQEFPLSFTTHAPLGQRKTKSLAIDDTGGTMRPLDETGPEDGPHVGATP
jgi:hypothetical protein